jgi:hypothetical protein
MNEWGAQSFQAVWFTPPGAVDIAAIFTAIVGAKSDSFHQQSVGISIALGSDGVRQFRVQSQPGRIDYFETALGNAADAFPLFNVKEAFAAFASRVTGGIQSAGSANRLAVVVQLAKQVAKASEASLILGEMLNCKMPFDDVTNLGFQVNKRRAFSDRSDLDMNRLMTMQLQNIAQFDMIDPAAPVVKNIEYVTISIDCNTQSRENFALQPIDQVPIWSELMAECERLFVTRTVETLN